MSTLTHKKTPITFDHGVSSNGKIGVDDCAPDSMLPPFCPRRKPLVLTNKYQDGLLKMVGKIDMRVWTVLWHISGDADKRGMSTMGELRLSYATGWSKTRCGRWLSKIRDMEWFDNVIVHEPQTMVLGGRGANLEARRIVYKKLSPSIPGGIIVPKNVIGSSIHTKTKYALFSLFRSRHYRPMFDQDMSNFRNRVLWARRVDKNKRIKKARRLKRALRIEHNAN